MSFVFGRYFVLRPSVHINACLSGREEAIELGTLRLRQVTRECIVELLQPRLSSSGDEVAERRPTWPNDTLGQQPGIGTLPQDLGPRSVARHVGEVAEHALSLRRIAPNETEVLANTFEMGRSGLVVLRVLSER